MAETLAEVQAKLTRVQTAIAAVESGHQSYQIDGLSFREADLPVLYQREQTLLRQVDRLSRGGIRIKRFVPE